MPSEHRQHLLKPPSKAAFETRRTGLASFPFAVGDDWQAIFRFAGSDIAVMQEFGERFGDYERIDLETTFRCSDHIAEVATEFVLRNPAQISKTVRARNKAERPAVQIGLPSDKGLSLLKEALDRIADDARRQVRLSFGDRRRPAAQIIQNATTSEICSNSSGATSNFS